MDGLESLLSPLKKVRLPIGEVSLMMMMAMRFIPLLIDEAEKISKAQKARCADLESRNPITRVKNLVPMLIPLFSGSLRRAEEMAIAMEARCFIPGAPRTRLYELKFKRIDFVALILVLLFIALVWAIAK
jgi:energy-coupling factor transport system permease protein